MLIGPGAMLTVLCAACGQRSPALLRRESSTAGCRQTVQVFSVVAFSDRQAPADSAPALEGLTGNRAADGSPLGDAPGKVAH